MVPPFFKPHLLGKQPLSFPETCPMIPTRQVSEKATVITESSILNILSVYSISKTIVQAIPYKKSLIILSIVKTDN